MTNAESEVVGETEASIASLTRQCQDIMSGPKARLAAARNGDDSDFPTTPKAQSTASRVADDALNTGALVEKSSKRTSTKNLLTTPTHSSSMDCFLSVFRFFDRFLHFFAI